MAYSSKSALILVSLVLSIYIMRNTDLSPGSVFSHALRALATSRPTISMCADVDINAPFSSQQINQAKAVLDSVQMLRGGNKLLDYLNEGNKEAMDYVKPLIPVIIPWAVMLIISILCCFSLYCNWCYLHGCCKNNKICSCCRAPKHQTKMKRFVVLSSIFLVCTLGASIAGLIFSRQVAPGIKRTFCSVMSLGGDLVYGNSNNKWVGTSPAIASLDKLLADFDSTVSSLNRLGDPAQVSQTCQDGKDEINKFILEHRNKVASRAAADHSAETYKPAYIANIEPATVNTTYGGIIQREFEVYNNTVVTGQKSVDSSIGTIQSTQTAIKDAVNEGRGIAVDIDTSVQDFVSTVYEHQDDVESAITGLNIGLLVFFLVYLVLSVLSIVAIILVVKFRVKIFSKCLHLSWCLFIILTLLGFILCGVLFTGSIVAAEGCDSANILLSDKFFFGNVTARYLKQDDMVAANIINTCLFTPNANILSQFGLTNSLVSFYTIYAALDAINTLIPFTSSSPPTSQTIPPQILAVTQMRDGLLPDSTETANDLTALNAATSSTSNSCTNIKDTWLLNVDTCTTSQGAKFGSGNTDMYDKPNPTCIGFDSNSWGTKPASNRYSTSDFPLSCSDRGGMSALNYVLGSVTGFQTNRVQVKTILDSVLSTGTADLGTINDKFNLFIQAIMSVLTELVSVKQKLQSIEAALVGPTSGLIPNSNCVWIKGSAQVVVGSMCVEFLSGVYFTSVMIIIMSVMSLLSAMWVFVLLKRVNLPKYEMAKTTSPAV